MANTIFTAENFAKVIKSGDSRRYGVDLKNHRQDVIDDAISECSGVGFKPDIQKLEHSAKGFYSVKGHYPSVLLYRLISLQLVRKFRIKFPDRNSLVRATISAVSDSVPMAICRRDISAFYENINVASLRQLICNDSAINPIITTQLEYYFDWCEGNSTGLPRGLGLSAVLAEMALQTFDRKVRERPDVFFYARFVDDILVIASGPNQVISTFLEDAMPRPLTFSDKKRKRSDLWIRTPSDVGHSPTEQTERFSYLGYEFSVPHSGKKNYKGAREIKVDICPSKIRKLKTRTILAFESYIRSYDYGLLRDRLRFISSNYTARRNGTTHVPSKRFVESGVFFSYTLRGNYKGERIGEVEPSSLKKLDVFLRRLILNKTSKYHAALHGNTTPVQIKRLLRFSFEAGHTKKIVVRFHPERMKEIKTVWSNV